jgi:hypothetical protein
MQKKNEEVNNTRWLTMEPCQPDQTRQALLGDAHAVNFCWTYRLTTQFKIEKRYNQMIDYQAK